MREHVRQGVDICHSCSTSFSYTLCLTLFDSNLFFCCRFGSFLARLWSEKIRQSSFSSNPFSYWLCLTLFDTYLCFWCRFGSFWILQKSRQSCLQVGSLSCCSPDCKDPFLLEASCRRSLTPPIAGARGCLD